MHESFHLLIDDLKNDDLAIKVNSIYRIKIVVALQNNQENEETILPLIKKIIEKEDDEVLFALAKELPNIFNIMPKFQKNIIQYLLQLCEKEETVIREQAVQSIESISKKLSENDIQELLVQKVCDYISNQDFFTQRLVGIQLCLVVYPNAGNDRTKLREKFFQLKNEDNPQVKRLLATSMVQFAKIIEKDKLISELVPLLKTLAVDDLESVRSICYQNLDTFVNLMSKDEIKHNMPSMIIGGAKDKSWRVRLNMSQNFPELFKAFGKDMHDSTLFPQFKTLITHSEPEVQQASLISLSKSLDIISSKSLESLVSIYKELQNSSKSVKSELAKLLPRLVEILSPQLIKQHLLSFLFVDNEDVIAIKIGVIEAAGIYINKVEKNQELINLIQQSCQDSKWRVREQCLKTIVQFFNSEANNDLSETFENEYLSFFKDRVNYIRERTLETLNEQTKLNPNFVLKKIIPQCKEHLLSSNNYLLRISALYICQKLAKLMQQDQFQTDVMPFFQKLVKDPVANVRLVAAKVFKNIKNFLSKQVQNTIGTYLQELVKDQDKDVQFYSQDALDQYI